MPPSDDTILEFVRVFILEHGYSPTIREIRDSLLVSSTSVVAYRLQKLEARGLLYHESGMARTLSVGGKR